MGRSLYRWWAGKRRCVIALLGMLPLVLAGLSSSHTGQAQPPNRAGIVVRFGDGSVLTRCISFDEPQISGIAALARAELAVEQVSDPGLGTFICKIEHDGCPATSCLCAYPPTYWRYWLLATDGWQSSPVGASTRVLRPGDVDGWTWGSAPDESTAPPPTTFEAICATAADQHRFLPLVVVNGN